VRRKGDDFASELKEEKGRAIWLPGSARELLITSHVIGARLLMRVATKMWKRLRDEHGSQ